ncbi:MAG: Rid family hydrolase [Alphaproteobacteria bacterium]
MRKTVSSPDVKKPDRAALTGGVAVGDQVILSGQMAYDPDVDGIPADMDAAAQTRVIMENIGHLLASEGLDHGDIVKVTIFLTDLGDLRAMNDVYSSYVAAPYPARSTVGVTFLAIPNGRVEIEATAVRR